MTYMVLSDGFTDMHVRLIVLLIAPGNRVYNIVTGHGHGLPPEYNYTASVLPRLCIIFWLPSLSLSYIYITYI